MSKRKIAEVGGLPEKGDEVWMQFDDNFWYLGTVTRANANETDRCA